MISDSVPVKPCGLGSWSLRIKKKRSRDLKRQKSIDLVGTHSNEAFRKLKKISEIDTHRSTDSYYRLNLDSSEARWMGIEATIKYQSMSTTKFDVKVQMRKVWYGSHIVGYKVYYAARGGSCLVTPWFHRFSTAAQLPSKNISNIAFRSSPHYQQYNSPDWAREVISVRSSLCVHRRIPRSP